MFLLDTHHRDVSAFSRIALHATFSIKLLFIPLISLLELYTDIGGLNVEEFVDQLSGAPQYDWALDKKTKAQRLKLINSLYGFGVHTMHWLSRSCKLDGRESAVGSTFPLHPTLFVWVALSSMNYLHQGKNATLQGAASASRYLTAAYFPPETSKPHFQASKTCPISCYSHQTLTHCEQVKMNL
ncbi:hypothetical protein TNCV_2512801 [Trichonephila clavipes]|nr:hypothetical protein TNCV_2512801 [Trichonephila clavipes]